MGFSLFSFLFAGFGPQGSPPRLGLRRFYHGTDDPPKNYTVIDVETTGLDACTCEILELAAVRYRESRPVSQYRTLVRPVGKIPASASKVNHITWRRVYDAPLFENVIQDFLNFIGDDTLIGYNIGFDIKFIQTRTQQDLNNQAFDVLSFAREMLPNRTSYKLDSLRLEFGLEGTAHTSLGDCMATAQLYQLCLKSEHFETYISTLAVQREQERQRQLECLARQQALAEKRARLMEKVPSTRELHQISAQMTGSAYDYVSAANAILASHGRTDCHLKACLPKYELTRGEYRRPFYGAKTSGRLKYVYFDIPCDLVSCPYTVTPTAYTEFEDGTRIYVPSPDALNEISDILLQAYEGAIPYYCNNSINSI